MGRYLPRGSEQADGWWDSVMQEDMLPRPASAAPGYWEAMEAEEARRYGDRGGPPAQAEPLPVLDAGGQTNTAPGMTDAVYTLERSSDGKVYIQINSDILSGIPESQWKTAVRTMIQRIFQNGVRLPRGTIFSNRKGRGEYSNGSYTRMLERTDPKMCTDKLRMSVGADGILQSAENVQYEDAAHQRNDDIVGFNRGQFIV